MCDFLISCSKKCRGSDLLEMIKKPYGIRSPQGFSCDFTWGSAAVLEEHFYANNVRFENGRMLAWIGDLVTDMSERYVADLSQSILRYRSRMPESLTADPVFRQLNGAFAIVMADNDGFCVITDPRNFLTVYAGNDGTNINAVGSHCDTVAAVSSNEMKIDEVHAAEFLNFGAICFPNTMYKNVTKLEPASILNWRFLPEGDRYITSGVYWRVPNELSEWNENELAEELGELLKQAVRRRCTGPKQAVTLSGGLDSRLILACVPQDVNCTAITFCDSMNREARTAQKIAKCCTRQWMPLARHDEYVGDNLLQTIRFTGCQGLFAYAHMIGFADQINSQCFNSILSGTQMDVYLKSYYAYDLARIDQIPRLRRGRLRKLPYDFIHGLSGVWQHNFTSKAIEMVYESRRTFFDKYADPDRSSNAEWLMLNPIDTMFVSWRSERRLLPLRLVALDRDILEFCFKCPGELKIGDYIFLKAAVDLMGPAAHIPSANSGVVPAAGMLSNLFRRSARKLNDAAGSVCARVAKPKIQHSWHDYQAYWRQSSVLKDLVARHGHNLDRFEGKLFRIPGSEILSCPDLEWHHAFRLLQFAVWLDVVGQCRQKAHPSLNQTSIVSIPGKGRSLQQGSRLYSAGLRSDV